ncbi:DUF4271 domain-containing protein [Chitinophagaceae bacterium LB-8]|uniref:DUF4271 domain-containing protein n=1 Tax=Paraflavisolibacter caeni TaxID=2982496 RepID=A0A9X2XTH0_9BACT|nr:DUF4271 domain-containing protein [Paraflavisolibacter caeni]MCU7548520.1 DUF4271 domain-containing protein [Paraflavisolibacter caeni]
MKYILIVIFSFSISFGFGQSTDSLRVKADSVLTADTVKKDTVAVKIDSAAIRAAMLSDSLYKLAQHRFYRLVDTTVYSHNPFFSFKNPEKQISEKKIWRGKEALFYSILLVLIIFALVKNMFPRYLDDIFRIFFRTSMKQRQIREQMMNTPLASLLYNLIFLLAGSLFVTLLFQHYRLGTYFNFWLLLLYGLAGLAIIYAGKFITLKIFGWMLNISDATDIYIFIVFTANKVAGVLILPFIIGLAFTDGILYTALFTVSLIMVGSLFLYRFYLSFVSVHKLIQINIFHFLIYLCAFEIAPLLLINKLLLAFFAESH